MSDWFTVTVNKSDLKFIRIRACTKHVIILTDVDHQLGHAYVNIGAEELFERIKMTPIELRDWLLEKGAQKAKREKKIVSRPIYD